MEESILLTIKKLIGIDAEDESFDLDLLVHINAFIPVLRQLGIDVPNGFEVTSDTEVWSQMLSSNADLSTIRTWMVLRIRKIFDPPQSGTVMDALNSSINELEWRINVAVDPGN